jgi:hypothetical protein
MIRSIFPLFDQAQAVEVPIECPGCGLVIKITRRFLIEDRADLVRLFEGTIHAETCSDCLGVVELDTPLSVRLADPFIRPLLYLPFRLLEAQDVLDELSRLPDAVRVCHSLDELVRQVEVELLLARRRSIATFSAS